MTNREIVDKNYDLILQCIDCQFAKMNDQRWKEDFTNDLFLILLTYDNEKMNDADTHNHFNALVSRIIINQIFSITSPYYSTYIKFENKTEELKGDDGEED